MTVLQGVIHGNRIELDSAPGLPEGQPVKVMLQPLLPPGEGIRQSAGAWADAGEELDRWLEQTRRSRDDDRAELER